jgi:hypothetical protein
MLLKRIALGRDAKSAVQAEMEKIRQEYLRALPKDSPPPDRMAFEQALSEITVEKKPLVRPAALKAAAAKLSSVACKPASRACSCGAINAPENAFCCGCGKRIGPAAGPCCPHCKKMIAAGMSFCVHCGKPVPSDEKH